MGLAIPNFDGNVVNTDDQHENPILFFGNIDKINLLHLPPTVVIKHLHVVNPLPYIFFVVVYVRVLLWDLYYYPST